jgi:hypothetical protein
MTPNNDTNNQGSFSLNRGNPNDQQNGQAMQQQGMPQQQMQSQTQAPAAGAPQQPFIPLAAFPANLQRDYDPGIKQLVFDLVERKYCPNSYIARYQQMSAADPQKYPPIDQNTIAMLQAQGPDVSADIRDFEVARVYNRVEIEVYELSLAQLPEDKKNELRVLTEQAQNGGMGANQEELVNRIKDFMQMNVPSISSLVDRYMRGFMNQYLAGRY